MRRWHMSSPVVSFVLVALTLVLAQSVSAQGSGPHSSFSGVDITLSKAATSTGIIIDATREFSESDRRVIVTFKNTTSQFKSFGYEVTAIDVEGLPNGFASWRKQFINLQARQTYTITLNAQQGLMPGRYKLAISGPVFHTLDFSVESRFARAELFDEEMRLKLGPNIALQALGAQVTTSSQHDAQWSSNKLIDGFNYITNGSTTEVCTNCGWSAKDGDIRPVITVDLPTDRATPIQAVVFDTRMFVKSGQLFDEVSAWFPKEVKISVSTDTVSSGFKEVAIGRVRREFEKQVIFVPAGTEAKFVRVEILNSHGWPGGAAFAELEVREMPGLARSILDNVDIDLASPGLGGVLTTYSGFHDQWPASRLFDGDLDSAWVSRDSYVPQDFVVAFKNDALASLEEIQIGLSERAGSASWPSQIAISVSRSSPLEGFVELGRFDVAKRAGLQYFPVEAEGRFLKLRLLSNRGAERTSMSALRVIETRSEDYRSILLKSPVADTLAQQSEDAAALASAMPEQEPNDSLASANPLKDQTTVTGRIDPLGEADFFELPALGEEAVALNLDFLGLPYIRHRLDILAADGQVLSSFDPGSLPARNAQLTFLLGGQEKYLKVSEPPASVVVIWDTSGSMKGSESNLARAVRDYIRRAPDTQSIQLIRFSDQVEVLNNSTFSSDKTQLLNALRGKFQPDGGTSLYAAISRGISQLKGKEGNRAIVVMTDGQDNGQLWHDTLWKTVSDARIRLYTIGLGNTLETYSARYATSGQRILKHLALGTNGEAFFASDSASLQTFYARIADQLATPATYLITPEIQRGRGELRVLSTAEHVPSAAMPSVHLILDLSGSMGERLPDGRTKIESAKEAIEAFFENLPDGMEFALTVYGKDVPESVGKDRACKDIQTVRPMAPLIKSEMLGSIRNFKLSGGTTPFWDTIAGVVSGLDPEANSLVIAVTDGVEECNFDMIKKLGSLGITKDLNSEIGLSLVGPYSDEVAEKVKALGLNQTELNVLGFDLDAPEAVTMMQKIATLGGGAFYEADDSASLAQSLKLATSATYRVFDAAGNQVSEGKIDGPAHELPVGIYTVEIQTATGVHRTPDVRIGKDLVTTLAVSQTGQEMDIAAGQPATLNPWFECGLPATKRPGGKPAIVRIQEKLLAIGHDPKGADGAIGNNTKAAMNGFAQAYGLALPHGNMLLLEQHLDCIGPNATGQPFEMLQ